MIGERVADGSAPRQPFTFTDWNLVGKDGAVFKMGEIGPSALPALEQGILLATVDRSKELPVTPLNLRTDGFSAGMRMKIVVSNSSGGTPKVYPVSVRNNDSGDDSRIVTVEKNLISGRKRVVSVSGDGSSSLFELEEKVRVDDLVGAPVIDAFGHVAAIVTGPDHGGAREGMARRVRGFGMDALRMAVGK
jgi:hypothetical protein